MTEGRCVVCGNKVPLVETWDDGYEAGQQDARAVQETWPVLTANPHRTKGVAG